MSWGRRAAPSTILSCAGGQAANQFQFVPRLDADKTLPFTLKDSDGIRSPCGWGSVLSPTNRRSQRAAQGIGTATRRPACRRRRISDDYGVRVSGSISR
jgi:hypothetical protein